MRGKVVAELEITREQGTPWLSDKRTPHTVVRHIEGMYGFDCVLPVLRIHFRIQFSTKWHHNNRLAEGSYHIEHAEFPSLIKKD